MPQTAANSLADSIIPASRAMLWYAAEATSDIPADRFARRPDGVTCSSPAFALGHLAIYPDKLLADFGLPHQDQSRYAAMFEAGNECKDDPDGSIYPSKDEILKLFFDRHNALIEALPSVDEATLAKPNPNERMRDMFPTLGSMAVFMLTSHTFMHLGQISTWRRVMGLGACMKM